MQYLLLSSPGTDCTRPKCERQFASHTPGNLRGTDGGARASHSDIISAPTLAFALASKDAAQPPSHIAVDCFKDLERGVLEVLIPPLWCPTACLSTLHTFFLKYPVPGHLAILQLPFAGGMPLHPPVFEPCEPLRRARRRLTRKQSVSTRAHAQPWLGFF